MYKPDRVSAAAALVFALLLAQVAGVAASPPTSSVAPPLLGAAPRSQTPSGASPFPAGAPQQGSAPPSANAAPASQNTSGIPIFPTTDGAARRAASPQGLGPGFAPSPTANMTYHGGPIMQTVKAYAIFWTPHSTIPAGYQNLISQYFSDVGNTNFYNLLTQYYQNPGAVPIQNVSTFGGAYVDTAHAYPHAGTTADPLLDADIQAEVVAAAAANPTWDPPGLTTMYFVFTEPGVESCVDATLTECTPGMPHAAYYYSRTYSG